MYCAVEEEVSCCGGLLTEELFCGGLPEEEFSPAEELVPGEELSGKVGIDELSSISVSLIFALLSKLGWLLDERGRSSLQPLKKAAGTNRQSAAISAANDVFFFIIFSPF